jgi:hypothetical protein
MQHDIRAALHTTRPDFSARRMKQRQHLGRSIAPILMGQLSCPSILLPTIASYWHGLEGAGFVFGPHS